MPEFRSGARRACLRSKKVDKAADPVGSPAVPPPQGRARRRGGAVAGSGRGNKAAAKGRGRSASKHRGKGLEAIDLQTDLPFLEPVVAGEAVIGTTHKNLCLTVLPA